MGRISAATAILLAAAATALAGLAFADSAKVRDDKRETKQLVRNGRLDIVQAKVSHSGDRVKHTVTMRKRVKPKRKKERPLIGLNTRGKATSDPEYLILGESVFRVRENADPRKVASAKLTAKKKRWTYRFTPADLEIDSYGWVAITTKGEAFDTAPAKHYKNHDLS